MNKLAIKCPLLAVLALALQPAHAQYPSKPVRLVAFPAKTWAEFLAVARKNPGKFSYASAGEGTLLHLIGESLQSTVGIKLLHVPYKGMGRRQAASHSCKAILSRRDQRLTGRPMTKGTHPVTL